MRKQRFAGPGLTALVRTRPAVATNGVRPVVAIVNFDSAR